MKVILTKPLSIDRGGWTQTYPEGMVIELDADFANKLLKDNKAKEANEGMKSGDMVATPKKQNTSNNKTK